MSPSGQRAEAGFSVLEIFVALLILSIGLLSLAMLQISTLTATNPSSASRERTATVLAQGVLDRLAAAPWEGLSSSRAEGFRTGPQGATPDHSRLPADAGDSLVVRGTTYYRLWQVRPDPEIPALKTITVWCCWRPGKRAWRQVVLVTQRSDARY